MIYEDVLEYISAYWTQLIQNDPPNPSDEGTLIGLPRPYLIPNRREFSEMYYWDSFFMALGMVHTGREQIILDIAENCAYLIERFGYVPNANRYYLTSRSQPPFFTQIVRLAYDVKLRRGDADTVPFLDRMRKLAAREQETAWLSSGTESHRHERLVYRGLSRYRDVNANHFNSSCESGWDHSTRCDGFRPEQETGRWLDFLPVCLNSILYVREKDLEWAASIVGDTADAQRWADRAMTRAATMHEVMWSEERKFYYDFEYSPIQGTDAKPSLSLHETMAGFYPLWAGLATKPQAESMVRKWLPRFLHTGGMVTSLPSGVIGRQWAFPNGWAPLQWIVVNGLERYGYRHEAMVIRRWWCDNCAHVFRNGAGPKAFGQGMLLEKYNVVDVGQLPEPGMYGTGVGFGWSNAIFVDFARTLNAEM
ncbi:MAG: trehalase family glycosidase [Gemmataceae bacterium]